MTVSDPRAASETFLVYPDSGPDSTYTGSSSADAGEFFSTLLDIINPLQHIPLVSSLYRELTGDEISPHARMVGSAVFGGPIGFASATANVLIEQASGNDLMGHAVALVSGGTPERQPTLLAGEAVPAAPVPPPPSEGARTAVQAEADGIVWSGPRVVPLLAGNEPTGSGVAAPVAELAAAGAREASREDTGAVDGDQPDWLPGAMADAARTEQARSNGASLPTVTAQPWIANAMFEALDKYEALARTRTDTEPAPDEDETGS